MGEEQDCAALGFVLQRAFVMLLRKGSGEGKEAERRGGWADGGGRSRVSLGSAMQTHSQVPRLPAARSPDFPAASRPRRLPGEPHWRPRAEPGNPGEHPPAPGASEPLPRGTHTAQTPLDRELSEPSRNPGDTPSARTHKHKARAGTGPPGPARRAAGAHEPRLLTPEPVGQSGWRRVDQRETWTGPV